MGVRESDSYEKFFKDYLLVGGVLGRFFHQTSDPGRIYEVLDCTLYGRPPVNHNVFFITKKIGAELNSELCLDKCLYDREATSEEVQREKESTLSKKAQEDKKPAQKIIRNSLGAPLTGPHAEFLHNMRKRSGERDPEGYW